MKRSKETIINRRSMHRYQEQYRLWRYKILVRPLLNIPANLKWDQTKWLEYCKSGILLLSDVKYII